MTARQPMPSWLGAAAIRLLTEPAMTEPRNEPAAARPALPRGLPTADRFVAGIRAGDRAMLARAITLVESTASAHEALAQEVLQRVFPDCGHARRVGITGVPGVGKSTFIETLGCRLCEQGRKVAVLAIDPTSSLSRGSILGDRTRMERLTANPNAFIRPSPSGTTVGGVARRTRETLLLCEAAGFDVVLVETVGVGQGETSLRSMVDFFLLLLLPGAGDDLQGIKRGIMEMADAILVNKADGENRLRAEASRSEQALAAHHLAPVTPGWVVPVMTGSGLTGEGISEAWAMVERFYAELGPSGAIAARRRTQSLEWMEQLAQEALLARFRAHPGVRQARPLLERVLLDGGVTAVRAATVLLDTFLADTHRGSIHGSPTRSVSPPNPPAKDTPC